VVGEAFTILSDSSNADMRRILWDLFIEVYSTGKSLAIFIDDADRLVPREGDNGVQSLAWLPHNCHHGHYGKIT
jgi:hypothetical protein